MALYKDGNMLGHSDSAEFEKEHKPGDSAPHSGIYRCKGCRKEVASNEGQPLPPREPSPAHAIPRGDLLADGCVRSARPEIGISRRRRAATSSVSYLPREVGDSLAMALPIATSRDAGTLRCMNSATALTSGSISSLKAEWN